MGLDSVLSGNGGSSMAEYPNKPYLERGKVRVRLNL